MFAFAHLCVSVCACVFMCSCICSRTTVFLPPGFLCCFVLFHFPPLLAGNKHWLSVSSRSSSFRSRGSGGWANAAQECQALFRKLGFCFVPLLNRSCFFCSPLGHKQGLGPQSSLLPAICFPSWNPVRRQQRLGRLILSLVSFG